MRSARALLLLCLAAAGLAAAGCGKKGPPLAPLARVPGRAMEVAARRTGDVVAITFTIPSANIDESKPADIARVDLYAYTAMAQNDVRDTKRMTLVGTIPVRKPPEPEPEGEKKKPGPPPPPEPGENQGAAVTVTETLTAEMRVPLAPDGKPRVVPEVAPVSWFDMPLVPPLTGPVPTDEPRRFYVVYGVSRGGDRGGASPRPAVPLGAPPAPPLRPRLEATERGIVVGWDTPPGARLPYQEPAEEGVLRATHRGMDSAPPLAYLVYRGPTAEGKARLTEKPVTARTITDPDVEFGVERCYDVRTVRVQGTVTLESEPSPPACITPADTFPPPAPAALVAVAGEGAISLIWRGVDASDLAGYIVMRGEAAGGDLTPLVDAPLRESTYRDATAKPGVRYVYAVLAVDRATPPNRSAMSNKVEETAR
ncbi:MAG TPA: hypothetical protein VLN08_15525 [Vicinamibacterales bacterium]|nr:hypothetical protein [Vicinamibacterales bacterium]